MEMIQAVLQENKQVIMLIPEIALTYQTVVRFQKRFGDRVTILNSRMSEGENTTSMRGQNKEKWISLSDHVPLCLFHFQI